MASSDMASVEPWMFSRHTFVDPWFSEAFSRDTETLTNALKRSLSNTNTNTTPTPTTTTSNHSNNSSDNTLTPDIVSPFLITRQETPASDHETASKRQRSSIPAASSGKVSKRKSRASKRSQTTYITADPANFRQMVQQVTGVRLGNSSLQISPVLKPEPQRPGGRPFPSAACLPTLDTSAFLLDHHPHPNAVSQPPPLQEVASVGTAAAAAATSVHFETGAGGGGGFDFGSFGSFPTLESWTASAL